MSSLYSFNFEKLFTNIVRWCVSIRQAFLRVMTECNTRTYGPTGYCLTRRSICLWVWRFFGTIVGSVLFLLKTHRSQIRCRRIVAVHKRRSPSLLHPSQTPSRHLTDPTVVRRPCVFTRILPQMEFPGLELRGVRVAKPYECARSMWTSRTDFSRGARDGKRRIAITRSVIVDGHVKTDQWRPTYVRTSY